MQCLVLFKVISIKYVGRLLVNDIFHRPIYIIY